MNRLTSTLLFFIGLNAWAYIPNTDFVLSKVVGNHGKGSYVIDQELTIREPEGASVIQEKIYVVDGGEVLVTAHGADGFKTWRLTKKGRVYWLDNASEKSDGISPDNPFGFLLTRSLTDYKSRLSKLNILSEDALKTRPEPKDLKDTSYEPESGVRLGRVSGTVAIAYGQAASADQTAPPPGLWIDQDLFVVRKYRVSPDAEVVGDEPMEYSKGFWYPRQQSYTFGGHTASVRVVRVQSAELPTEIKKQFDVTTLRTRSDLATLWPKSPMAVVIQDFYKRFR